MPIRASELVSFAFCERAWHYNRIGLPSETTAEISRGEAWHARMERKTRRALLLMRLGLLFLLGGLTILLLRGLGV